MLLQDATGTLISGDGQGRLCLDPSPLWFGLCFSTKWIYIEKEDTMLFTLLRPPYVQLHHLWEVVLKGGARLFPGAGGEGALHLRPPPVDVHKPTGNPLLFCVCKWLPALSARRGRGRWCPSAYPRGVVSLTRASSRLFPGIGCSFLFVKRHHCPASSGVYGKERGSHLSAGSALTKPCELGQCA